MNISKIYKITTRFIFEGTFKVANSKNEAQENVLENCGITISDDIPNDEID